MGLCPTTSKSESTNFILSIIEDDKTHTNGCWATTLVVNKKKFRTKEAIDFFKSKTLPLRPFFYPLTSMPGYSKYSKNGLEYENKNSKYLSSKGITLPSHYNITENQIEIIASTLIEYLKII